MKVIFTGTGTSQGVPVIGCKCEICTSEDLRDKRRRSGLFISDGGVSISLDVGPDFRMQMLSVKADRLDGILLTHEHNDHVAGLDDVRPFNFIQREPVRVYSSRRTAIDVKKRFSYIFAAQAYPGAPRVELVEIIPNETFRIGSIEILPFAVYHGGMEVLGFRFGRFTYITDANYLPPKTMELVEGSEILVLNALHHRKHHSHFNLQEALDLCERLEVKQAYFTHISHQMGKHLDVQHSLPQDRFLAYDGLSLQV